MVWCLWGPAKDLDYWTARRAGLVPPEERRAMALLASMTDERRLSVYCMTGQIPAMGNATKRIYLVRRYDRVLELDDGRPLTSWCIGARERGQLPETDHVVAMKNLIEGEEWVFRANANPTQAAYFVRPAQARNALLTPFLDEREGELAEQNAGIADFTGPHTEREQVRRAMGREREVMRQTAALGRLWGGAARGKPSDLAAAEWARKHGVDRAVARHYGIKTRDTAEGGRREPVFVGQTGMFGFTNNTSSTVPVFFRMQYPA